jgi:hypothetical protein
MGKNQISFGYFIRSANSGQNPIATRFFAFTLNIQIGIS